MTGDLTSLRNLGPVTARRLAALGIADVAALRALGAVAAYARLRHAYPRETSLNALDALAGALLDVPWNRLPAGLKSTLRAQAESNKRGQTPFSLGSKR